MHKDNTAAVLERRFPWQHLWNRYRALDQIPSIQMSADERISFDLATNGQLIAVYCRNKSPGFIKFYEPIHMTVLGRIEAPPIKDGQFTHEQPPLCRRVLR